MRNTLIILFLLFGCTQNKVENTTRPSQNSIRVQITNTKSTEASAESKLQFVNTTGKVIYETSFVSEDGEHGFGVVNSGWSPDSNYFVFNLTSSGGHQSWHFPTCVYSVAVNKLFSLDDILGPITDPDFSLTFPDTIEVVGRGNEDLEESTFKVSISHLIKGQ